jgi:putative transcription factor
MKSSLTGATVNDQQWEPVVLKKSSTSKTVQNNQKSTRVLSEEEKIDRQKIITKVLQQSVTNARLAKKLSQKQLATNASLDISIIKEYESGKRVFNEAEVKKLEKALQCRLQRK